MSEITERRIKVPRGLHDTTKDLVARFAVALADKLYAAQEKYGHADSWSNGDWMDSCRQRLLEHLAKGDPRDVAAYCAFLWHHGESTAVAAPPRGTREAILEEARGSIEAINDYTGDPEGNCYAHGVEDALAAVSALAQAQPRQETELPIGRLVMTGPAWEPQQKEPE